MLLMQVSPADSQGCHGLGMAMDYTYELISQARTVVAEVNAAMPTTSALHSRPPRSVPLSTRPGLFRLCPHQQWMKITTESPGISCR